jgi:hypothetical protein
MFSTEASHVFDFRFLPGEEPDKPGSPAGTGQYREAEFKLWSDFIQNKQLESLHAL